MALLHGKILGRLVLTTGLIAQVLIYSRMTFKDQRYVLFMCVVMVN
jgi:hypothetical protein